MNLRNLVLFIAVFTMVHSKPNLHIGTGGFGFGCGSNSPAAQIPFSFVRLGPDTTPTQKFLYAQFQHYGGYSEADHAVKAFSHMHLVGAGVIDMGIIGVLPTLGSHHSPPVIKNEALIFSKSDEEAQPGYYSSFLTEPKIKVELTTSQRCGAHRYSYYNVHNKPMDIHIMTSYLLQKKASRFTTTQICGEKCIEGKIWLTGSFGGRFGGYNVHYHLEWTSEEPSETYLYKDQTIINGTEQLVSGNYTGAVIRTRSNIVQLFIGLSYVSLANAKQNFEQQVKGKTFNQIKELAIGRWKEELGRFDILAINAALQTKIDTAIYRTLLTPTIFEDSNGEYVSFKNDGSIKVKPANMSHIYTDMSLWDVHRSQMPWLLFQDPARFDDIAMSLVLINREGGYMPKWPFAQGPTGCMIGAHANTVLADWIIKEACKSEQFNKTQIFGYMLRNANTQTPHDSRFNPAAYIKSGYIPADADRSSSCSETLEYSYNDYGISQVAKLLNDQENEKEFLRRASFYKNVWNPKSEFFEPKYANGTFKKISKRERINIFSNNYVEGDAWHYRFYAPHDAPGLIKLFGGETKFVKELDKFFRNSFSWPTFWLPNPYYWAGNEHDLFSVWLFPYANRADLTQKYSRMIVERFYGLAGDGLPGNDDYATMSAWLVFASLGFYPLPSTETYVLGSPYVHYARISRKFKDGVKSFKIRAYNNSQNSMYLKESKLNGKSVDKFLKHSSMDGGQDGSGYLQFWMTSAKQ